MGSKTTAGYVLYRVFQTVFAVCVWAVSAAFLSQADELQPPREILKYSEPEHDPAQLADPPAVFMRENTPYYLASWELSEEELPGRMQYGESSVVYEKVGMNAEIPETAEISMEGENGLFTVPLVRSEYGNQRWEDDFSFTLTFHSCQADTYELGGIEISSIQIQTARNFRDTRANCWRCWGFLRHIIESLTTHGREKSIRTKEEHCAGTRVPEENGW